MKLAIILAMVALELGGAFGDATATVESLESDSMVVDIEVGVVVSAESVVAHLSFQDESAFTLPLLDRGGGVFGIRTELAPKNYVVVFEALGDPGGLSSAATLTELGAALTTGGEGEGVSGGGEDEETGLTPETRRLGWLALALGAASLSALAFWVLGDRDRRSDGEEVSAPEG